uniref:hypothetical protein n=1 Tax=uncultured Draconibacterium sp. TaxID=1573823 RepID=UPI0032169354
MKNLYFSNINSSFYTFNLVAVAMQELKNGNCLTKGGERLLIAINRAPITGNRLANTTSHLSIPGNQYLKTGDHSSIPGNQRPIPGSCRLKTSTLMTILFAQKTLKRLKNEGFCSLLITLKHYYHGKKFKRLHSGRQVST